MRRVLILPFLFLCARTLAASPRTGAVRVPVADLLSSSAAGAGLETQLLYGEPVVILDEQGDWLRVEIPGQPEFTHNGFWQGYPGWVRKSDVAVVRRFPEFNAVIAAPGAALFYQPKEKGKSVPLSPGANLRAGPEVKGGMRIAARAEGGRGWVKDSSIRFLDPPLAGDAARTVIVKTAESFLGDPYLWGGRSKGAVDCSGLVHLAYQAAGLSVPRDSHEQSLKARKILPEELLPGDLIFSAPAGQPGKVTHVAVYAGDGKIIEAPRTGETVRNISFAEKFGLPLEAAVPEEPAGDRVIRFGAFLGK